MSALRPCKSGLQTWSAAVIAEWFIIIVFLGVILIPGIYITYLVVRNGSKSEPEAPWVRNSKDLR